MKYTTKFSALAFTLAGTLGAAEATTLDINVPVYTIDSVAAPFGGTLLDFAMTNISNSSYNGVARTAVYDTGTGLDFYYQFSNDASSVNGLERFSAYNFSSLGSVAVDVYQTGLAFGDFVTGTEKSDTADRSSRGVIGFNFIPNGASKIEPGTTSFTQIIRTNARAYTAGNFGLLDGIGDNATGFATAVPEPESLAMLLAGLGLIGTIMRRRSGAEA
jgi:hypothetical protein